MKDEPPLPSPALHRMEERERRGNLKQPCAVVVFALLLLLPPVGQAQSLRSRDLASSAIVSRSRQFFVHTVTSPGGWRIPLARDRAVVRLEPELLAVSAERVKAAFGSELGLPGDFKGAIHLVLRDDLDPEQWVTIVSTRYLDGWHYRMDLPRQMNETKLVRTLTHVLLQEYANRNSPGRCAEIPLWLSEGMAAHILHSTIPGYILRPQSQFTAVVRQRGPLERAREILSTNPPPSFAELTSKSPADLRESILPYYSACAELLVSELLKVPGGAAKLRLLLNLLPARWNWQVAFLEAFRADFSSLLGVEKWWSLVSVVFSAHDGEQNWTKGRTFNKLDTILAVQRGDGAGSGQSNRVTLQQVIRDWPAAEQNPYLSAKVRQLLEMQAMAPLAVVPLIQAYANEVAGYLQRKSEVMEKTARNQVEARTRAVMAETIRRLDLLDQKREATRRQQLARAGVEP